MEDGRGESRVMTGHTSFSQLLLSEDLEDGDIGVTCLNLNRRHQHDSSLFYNFEPGPKMLCFGHYDDNGSPLIFPEAPATHRNQSFSPASSCTTKNGTVHATPTKSSSRKRNGASQKGPARSSSSVTVETFSGEKNIVKKAKSEKLKSGGNNGGKVRKEKIGDRISALQQLVSPYGKTDTASVLHEAMGYIRFLHDQVTALCSPYLLHNPPDVGGDQTGRDLRTRGLCLVPVSCTHSVANANGADFWSPAMYHGLSSSSSKQ